MLFSSTVFIMYFLPAVTLIYYGLLRKSRKLQNAFLTLASLLFYAWGEPKFVLVMLLSIVCNWGFGLLVKRGKDKNSSAAGKTAVALSVLFNLAVLFVFKYLTFTSGIVAGIFGTQSSINIALPIGISFFTFQAMSYVIDVYRGNGEVQKNVLNVALYISFFPQLIAGPIVRYETIAEQINNRKETLTDFFEGFVRFLVGFAKKVLLSNVFSIYADEAFGAIPELSVAGSWVGALCYTFQIFFDFSGYSDMAIGLGKMFGFHFLENFNYPYISRSISEFWRRWHISLGSWFRDYVYFPLGGSRVKKPRLVFNLFAVWMLTGIWHGANWTFFFWGLMYFVLIALEKLTGLDKNKPNKFTSVLRWVYTMLFVILGWVVFRANSLPEAFEYAKAMFGLGGNGLIGADFTDYLPTTAIYLIIGAVFSTPVAPFIRSKVKNNVFAEIIFAVLVVASFVLSLASIVSSTHNPFIYFNF